MTKVYPNACPPPPPPQLDNSNSSIKDIEEEEEGPIYNNNNNNNNNNINQVVLTVWRKSLLFNCHGFTVFDSNGDLVFRVDNYIAGRKGEIILMDASGTSLLTIRRKRLRLSLADNWVVYDRETCLNPVFWVKKSVNFLGTTSSSSSPLAHVISSSSNNNNKKKKKVIYKIEGSYAERCCGVYDDKRRRVAEIKRKEAAGGVVLGSDVFRLVILEPDLMDTTVAMALVVLLDQMFAYNSLSSLRPSLLYSHYKHTNLY